MIQQLKWRCLKPECKKEFWHYARKTVERKPSEPWQSAPHGEATPINRIMVDTCVCPFCENVDIEPFIVHVKGAED